MQRERINEEHQPFTTHSRETTPLTVFAVVIRQTSCLHTLDSLLVALLLVLRVFW